jgi:hypothetical protein
MNVLVRDETAEDEEEAEAEVDDIVLLLLPRDPDFVTMTIHADFLC